MTTFNQLDDALLTSYLDNLGKAIVEKMLALYSQQSVIYLNEINAAVVEQAPLLWRECCHKMKGAAGSTGLVQVHAKLVVLEKSTVSWQVKLQELNELVRLNDLAIAEFRQWLDSCVYTRYP